MRPPVLVTAPAALPVSVEDVKRHLRVEASDDDGLITALIQAAVATLDGYSGLLGRCLVSQTWRQDFDRFCRQMRLRLPASEVSSITWRNSAGQMATVSGDDYALEQDAVGSFVRFKNAWSHPSDLYEAAAVSISYQAGYGEIPAADSGAANPVPAPIRTAIILMVGDLYRSTKPNFEVRGETVDGVGEVQYSSPEVLARAAQGTVGMLLQPFRVVLI